MYKELGTSQDDQYYKNCMINAILLESNYLLSIFPHFAFFMTQCILVTYHHMNVMQSGYEEGWEVYCTVFTLIAISTQVLHELKQIIDEGVNF